MPHDQTVSGIGEPPPNRTYLPGVSVAASARLVLASGAVGTDDAGDLAVGDTAAQTHQAFANLERVLDTAGCGLADVIKMTAFLTPEADQAAFNRVRNERLTSATYVSTSVRCGLNLRGALVEIEVTAAMGASGA